MPPARIRLEDFNFVKIIALLSFGKLAAKQKRPPKAGGRRSLAILQL